MLAEARILSTLGWPRATPSGLMLFTRSGTLFSFLCFLWQSYLQVAEQLPKFYAGLNLPTTSSWSVLRFLPLPKIRDVPKQPANRSSCHSLHQHRPIATPCPSRRTCRQTERVPDLAVLLVEWIHLLAERVSTRKRKKPDRPLCGVGLSRLAAI